MPKHLSKFVALSLVSCLAGDPLLAMDLPLSPPAAADHSFVSSQHYFEEQGLMLALTHASSYIFKSKRLPAQVQHETSQFGSFAQAAGGAGENGGTHFTLPEEFPWLPSVEDLLETAKKENVTVILNADRDHPVLVALHQLTPEASFWMNVYGFTMRKGHLMAVAEQAGISFETLKIRLRMPPSSDTLIMTTQKTWRPRTHHQILMEEVIHALQGNCELDPRWKNTLAFQQADELLNDFIQTLFYPPDHVDQFSSLYSDLSPEERWLLIDRYRVTPQRNPNTDIHEILEALRKDMRQEAKVKSRTRTVSITDLLLGPVNAKKNDYRQALAEDLDILLTAEKFSAHKPLFPHAPQTAIDFPETIYYRSTFEKVRETIFKSGGMLPGQSATWFSFEEDIPSDLTMQNVLLRFDSKKLRALGIHFDLDKRTGRKFTTRQQVPLSALTTPSQYAQAAVYEHTDPAQNKQLAKAMGYQTFEDMKKVFATLPEDVPAKFLAELLHTFTSKELELFMKKEPETFTSLVKPLFYFYYTVIRWLLIHTQEARKEELDKILNSTVNKIMKRGYHAGTRLADTLGAALSRPSSNKFVTAQEILQEPAVQKWINLTKTGA